jgi:transcriptional regulator with XRE-family HTH domain
LGTSRSLARRIAYERERLGLKQAGLARVMTNAGYKMTQSTISKFEQTDNPRRITVDELTAFSQVFGIRADQLLLPPEVAADRDFRRMLDVWRKSRLAVFESQDDLVQYLDKHPQMEAVLDDLLNEDDRTALLDAVAAGIATMRRRGDLQGVSIEDMRDAHKRNTKKKES